MDNDWVSTSNYTDQRTADAKYHETGTMYDYWPRFWGGYRDVCPFCGRCPHCGQPYPYHHQPYYPQGPYVTWTHTS